MIENPNNKQKQNSEFDNLLKIYNLGNYQEVEKEYLNSVSAQVSDYMDFMKENGAANQSFIKGTFIGLVVANVPEQSWN